MDIETTSLPAERGKRLRQLRDLLRFSRSGLSEKSTAVLGEKDHISEGSLKNWEYGRYGGLTEKGAKKLIHVFKAEGLECPLEWLLYGIGENPTSEFSFAKNIIQKQQALESSITYELRTFHQYNKNAVDCIIKDDSMMPYLNPGDYVAGSRYFDQDIDFAIGHTCIVQTATGEVLVRIVKMGTQNGLFTLHCSNPDTTVQQPLLENIKLFSAAPVVWIRKQLSN